LTGKYGEEGDRLIFKILESGDYFSKVPPLRELADKTWQDLMDIAREKLNLTWEDVGVKSKTVTQYISEKALRYDLTVPFARYVVQHQNDITFPFKRYQIQPVWRADRPQKGRYREFYQCDVDVIGSDSLLNEVELIQIIDEVFTEFGLKVTIKLNNRKILAGLVEVIGEREKFDDIVTAIDKLDKVGVDEVKEDLLKRGISKQGINKLQPLFDLKGTYKTKLEMLKGFLSESEDGRKGIEEIQKVVETFNPIYSGTEPLQINSFLELDITLARGAGLLYRNHHRGNDKRFPRKHLCGRQV